MYSKTVFVSQKDLVDNAKPLLLGTKMCRITFFLRVKND